MPRRRAPPVSPARHPFPPSDLDSRPLPIAENRGPWWRSYYPTTRGGQPWGPLRLARTRSNRFDSPTYRYGVLYAAENLDGALIETFGRNLTIRLLQLADLEARHLALVHASRSLRFVDLTGRGLAGLGADSRLWAGDDYEISQAWSRAFYKHPLLPDGLLYGCRHDPSERAVAIFGRVRRAMKAEALGSVVSGSMVVSLAVLRSLRRYGFKLDRPTITITRP